MLGNFTPEDISYALDTRIIGKKIIYYHSLKSTNDTAKSEAIRGTVEGTVVIAGEQTAGKGRLNRAWYSPKGNIALSVILYPDRKYLPSLIMLASLAVIRSIKQLTGLQAQIKWPNDVLIGEKKVAGILIENRVLGNKLDYAVMGIGVNVNHGAVIFPDLAGVATSLAEELGKTISLIEVVRKILFEMDGLYRLLLEGGSVFKEWRDNLVNLGRRVYLQTDEAILEGLAESVARDGGLMVRGKDGILLKVVSGDVLFHCYDFNPPSRTIRRGIDDH